MRRPKSGTASNIVTKATTDYAANIKTFVDQGYGIIVTVGFAMGDATTIAAKQYPKVKFIGVDQGVCIDENGKGDPTFACKGDAKNAPARTTRASSSRRSRSAISPASSRPVSRSRASSAPSAASTRSLPVVRYINGYRNGAASLNDKIDVKVAYVSTDINKAFNDPGTGKSIAKQMIGLKADVIFQVAGLSGAGAIEEACANPGVIGIGVDVDQSKSLPQSAKCILSSAEKKLVDAVTAAIGKVAAKTDVGGTSVWDASTTPVGVGLSPYGSDYKSLVTPELQAKIDAALAGMKAGTVDPCKPTPCDKKD